MTVDSTTLEKLGKEIHEEIMKAVHPRPWKVGNDFPLMIVDAEGRHVCTFSPSGISSARYIVKLVNQNEVEHENEH